MPASLVHMTISRSVRDDLRKQETMKPFVDEVLDKYPTFMELGALGPDLPYYGSLLIGAYNTFLNRTDRPLGVDQWSYQLHSKDTNVFPLKMIEVTWKETNMSIEEWEPVDRMKFAFLCGFLTHVAADQIIHPVVNGIAGFYYKKLAARDEHRKCEVHQDLYVIARQNGGKLPVPAFTKQSFGSWCMQRSELLWKAEWLWFRYFIQKAFVEAHAVTPTEHQVGKWIKGTVFTLDHLIHLRPIVRFGLLGPYGTAYQNLFDKAGELRTTEEPYREYIGLESQKLGRTYDAYLADAITLACIYVQAAYKVYSATEVDDDIRAKFKGVVQDADLGAPLETDILNDAKAALAAW